LFLLVLLLFICVNVIFVITDIPALRGMIINGIAYTMYLLSFCGAMLKIMKDIAKIVRKNMVFFGHRENDNTQKNGDRVHNAGYQSLKIL
jgi:hypothetical protein